MLSKTDENIVTPDYGPPQTFDNATSAVEYLHKLYFEGITFLTSEFTRSLTGSVPEKRYRAYYPRVSISTTSYTNIDSRLSFGYVAAPGTYSTTITRPDLFKNYLQQQLALLIKNHEVPLTVDISDTPIPVQFAMENLTDRTVPSDASMRYTLRDYFDVPDLDTTNDDISNGDNFTYSDGSKPLAPFTAQRVDYSLARLKHYTATSPKHFQNHVLFTNYQFYVEEFEAFARTMLADESTGYTSFVSSNDAEIFDPSSEITQPVKMPQMPAYHLKRANGAGITLVNIGVGPSNAKTATDHIAVLRPHAWLMVGHCAGLRNSQRLGDFVLAHAYIREDHVLDDDLPTWVPIPALAEVQIALQEAVASVTNLKGYELKRLMRTGTVATIDNRNWELRDQSGPVKRLSQSRAIALEMESATIAANGFRFRVPYGTLLCVSDKPLHGELKMPGMASEFYTSQVANHLMIGIKAMEYLRDMPLEKLHSRKLRSFDEMAFL